MRRGILTATAGAVLLVGCLFPSFDDFGATDSTTKTGGSSGDGGKSSSTSSGSDGSSSSSSGNPSSSSSSSTGGPTPEGGTTTPPTTFACGVSICTIGTQSCCDNGFGDEHCGNDCSLYEAHCLDAADCPTGQVCCDRGGVPGKSECATSCSDTIVCRRPAPHCPAGKTCENYLTGPPDMSDLGECK